MLASLLRGASRNEKEKFSPCPTCVLASFCFLALPRIALPSDGVPLAIFLRGPSASDLALRPRVVRHMLPPLERSIDALKARLDLYCLDLLRRFRDGVRVSIT